MQRKLFLLLLIAPLAGFGQTDSTKWLRAFPITDYMIVLNDSTKVIQLEMPDGLKLQDKQIGIVWGIYNGSKEEVVQKGYGRCYLVKGNYYYFAIGHNDSGLPLTKGDLLYTFMPRSSVYYGQAAILASHFIRLQNVYEQFFYDRYNIFLNWTEADEKKLNDSLVADIRFTGQYFLDNHSPMNKEISTGAYKGQKTLEVMVKCQPADVMRFFDYVIARPRLYAGKEWKISEIFATWLTEGAPTIVKD